MECDSTASSRNAGALELDLRHGFGSIFGLHQPRALVTGNITLPFRVLDTSTEGDVAQIGTSSGQAHRQMLTTPYPPQNERSLRCLHYKAVDTDQILMERGSVWVGDDSIKN